MLARRAAQGIELRVPGHVALGILSVLACRQHDAVAHEDRTHRPVAPGKRVLRLVKRLVHIIGVGHGRDSTSDEELMDRPVLRGA